jgi:hypothetical protein
MTDITPYKGGSMSNVKKPEGVEGHSWNKVPPKLPPEKQTRMTFFALGAMLPRRESKATVNSNNYRLPSKKLAKEGKETTELARENFPHIPPKFLK